MADDDAVIRIAAAQLGYRIPKGKLEFVRKLVWVEPFFVVFSLI